MTLLERILIVGTVMLWGGNFVIIRWGMEDVDPYIMTALRFTLIAFPAVFFAPRPSIPFPIMALHGILFGGGIWGLVNLAIFLGTPAGMASLLLQLSAFLSIIAGFVLFRETISWLKAISLACAFLGFAIITIFQNISIPLIGIMLVFVAALSWTVCNTIITKTKPNNALSFIIWSSLFVPIPVLLIPFFQAYNDGNVGEFFNLFAISSIKGWVSIAFQAFITTLMGYGIWTWAIARHGLVNVAPYSLLVPVSGLFLGWLFYNEVMSIPEITGAALILLGLMLLSIKLP